MSLAELKTRIEESRDVLANGAERSRALAESLSEAEAKLAEARRAAAQAEGEESMVARDAALAKSRLEAVSADLQAVVKANSDDVARRQALSDELEATISRRDAMMDLVAARQDELRALETESVTLSQALTERRIAASQMEQELSFVGQQSEGATRRREELERAIEGRESGIRGYEESIRRLTEESGDLLGSLDELKARASDCHVRMDEERGKRSGMMERIAAADHEVSTRRAGLDLSLIHI